MKRMQKVRWDRSIIMRNLLVLLLFGVSISFTITQCLENKISWGILAMFVFVFLVWMVGLAMLPFRIEMTDSKLVLRKIVGKLTIPYDQIEIITPYNLNVPRLISIYGFAEFTGLLRNDELGRFKAYIGDHRQTFFIRTSKGKNYVWSCENHDELIREVNEMRRAFQKEELFYYPKQ